MLPDGVIQASHIWKRFRADRHRRLLRDQLQVASARLRGRDHSGWRWALRDVELRADPGEAIGLIGVNGSGKSTLLKILTRVMYPYAGKLDVCGRVGALIEVRAGIHPDLTGRENVYLYGSLLGLKRDAVARRFDDIIEFAEISEAVDRQVKFYSSGMQMRLGFAVAAFLEPDVLLVDEVLAVGDANFQQRCLDRMRTVLAQGTTLVFVSHDLAAVESVCTRVLWMETGVINDDGPARDVLGRYRQSIEETAELAIDLDSPVQLAKLDVGGQGGRFPQTDGPAEVAIGLRSRISSECAVLVGISEGPPTPIFVLRREIQLRPGEMDLRCSISRLPLPRGRYFVWVGVFETRSRRDLFPWQPAGHFEVFGPDLDPTPMGIVRLAPIHVAAVWEIDQVESNASKDTEAT